MDEILNKCPVYNNFMNCPINLQAHGCPRCPLVSATSEVDEFYRQSHGGKIIPIKVARLFGKWNFYTKCWGLGEAHIYYENGEPWIYIKNENGEIVAKIKEQVLNDAAVKRGWWDKIWNKDKSFK